MLHVKSRGSDMLPFIMSGHGFLNQMIGIVQSVEMEQDFQCEIRLKKELLI